MVAGDAHGGCQRIGALTTLSVGHGGFQVLARALEKLRRSSRHAQALGHVRRFEDATFADRAL
jgi:hypothetical protein